MTLYSHAFQRIGTENAFKIASHISRIEQQGHYVLKLNLGEPDFDLPKFISEEIKRQLDLGNTHYCDPQGLLALREVIAWELNMTRGIEVSPDQVVVFPGAKPAIAFAQQAYLNKGDEVIYPSPGYPIYESLIEMMDAIPRPLHLREDDGLGISAEQIEELICPATKLIFLNFPSNPTGAMATEQELEEIAQVVLQKSNPECRVFSDEIYSDIVFDGRRHHSIASVPGMRRRTIVVSGFSKSFAWTGGRLGYAAFPTAEEAQSFKNLNINYFSCVPPFLQMAGATALNSPHRHAAIRQMVESFQGRRDDIIPALNSIPGVRCISPLGAFYAFPNIGEAIKDLGVLDAFKSLSKCESEDTSPAGLFQMFALYHHQVAVLDRRSFGRIGSDGQHYIRLSMAASQENLREGIRRLREALKDRDGFRSFVREGRQLCRG